MKNFTIENETNSINVHGSVKEAEAVPHSERFGSEAALAKLATDWPAARLVEIWNSLPGEAQVKKFKDRATAVSRIWKAVQTLAQTEERRPSGTVVAGDGCSAPDLLAKVAAAPHPEQPAAEEAQAPATPELTTTETVMSTTVAPQGANVAPRSLPRPRRPPARKRRTRRKRAHPAKEA